MGWAVGLKKKDNGEKVVIGERCWGGGEKII